MCTSSNAKTREVHIPAADDDGAVLLLYAYCVEVFSSRKVARATHEDIAFRFIAGGLHPHFATTDEFRLEHRDAFEALFIQIVRFVSGQGGAGPLAAVASAHTSTAFHTRCM